MAKLTDQSPMPFGKYRGEPLEKVPARYLLWLWEEGKWNEPGGIHDYIKESFSALESEAKDFIVTHRPQ